jgi:acetolactate synthase-1/2/3 large subunit
MIRGADIVARTLDRAGLTNIFTLSGNHIMPIFDAAIGTRLRLIHVRHEAAAVHMADAWGRLSGRAGVALVTGGQGHTNAVAALATAQAAESPLVLLSGHAGLDEIGRGAFQELQQAAIAAPLCKASWTAATVEGLGHDIARAICIATDGRPGPVHVSLPFDLLETKLEDRPALWPSRMWRAERCPSRQTMQRQFLPSSRAPSGRLFLQGRRWGIARVARCCAPSPTRPASLRS